MPLCPFCNLDLIEKGHSIVDYFGYEKCGDAVWECHITGGRFLRRACGAEAISILKNVEKAKSDRIKLR